VNDLVFVSLNRRKVDEVCAILAMYSIRVSVANVKRKEVQSDSLEEIALEGARYAASLILRPVIIEDAGLFIKSLNGFPGPYSSYVFKTIGNKGILRLLEGVEDRSAVFKSVVAYCKPGHEPLCFLGEAEGWISNSERGESWGFDPIFIPKEGEGMTYAEMGYLRKNMISHRKKALEKFAHWYLNQVK